MLIIYLSTQASYAENQVVLQTSSEVMGLVNDINKANIRSDMF